MVSCPTSRLFFSPRSPPAARNKLPYHTRPCLLPLPRGSSGLAQNGVSQRHSKHQKRKLRHRCVTVVPPFYFSLNIDQHRSTFSIFHTISLLPHFNNFVANSNCFPPHLRSHDVICTSDSEMLPECTIIIHSVLRISLFSFFLPSFHFSINIIHKQKTSPQNLSHRLSPKNHLTWKQYHLFIFIFPTLTNSHSTLSSHQFHLT